MKNKGMIRVISLMVILLMMSMLFVSCKSKEDKIDGMIDEAEDLLDDEEYKDAIDIFEEIIDMDDENIDAYYGLAEAYIGREKFDKAEKYLEEIIDIDEEEEDAYETLANLYYIQDGNIDKAIKLLEDGVDETDSKKLSELLNKFDGNMMNDFGTDEEDSIFDIDEEYADDIDEEDDFDSDMLDRTEIPENYPHGFVPLVGVDNAVVLGANEQEIDGVGAIYAVVFGVNRDADDIAAEIERDLQAYILNIGGSFESINGRIFTGIVSDYQFSVAVSENIGDGYMSTVDYTVMRMEEE